ncbi:hypothetical protein [Pelagicoccus albus]|nr:hypothetical protein [Pelagicoccus albus]
MNRVERMDTATFRRRVVAGSFPEYPDLGSAMNEWSVVQAN